MRTRRQVLVVGADEHVGRALAHSYNSRGDRVVGAYRQAPPMAPVGAVVIAGLPREIGSGAPTWTMQIPAGPIDLLINDGGLCVAPSEAPPELDVMRAEFELNVLRPTLLARDLQNRIPRGGKLILITSGVSALGSASRIGQSRRTSWRTAMRMATVDLAVDLLPLGIAVATINPGCVSTGLTPVPAALSCQETAGLLVTLIDRLSLDDTGTYLDAKGRPLPW